MRSRRHKRNIKKKILETISNRNFIIVSSILLACIIVCVGINRVQYWRELASLEKDKEMLEQKMEAIYDMGQKNLEEAEKTQTMASSIVRIAAVGDILCGNGMIEDASQGGIYNFTPMFANMPSYFEHADITLGTMETNFCEGQAISGLRQYNSPQSFAQAVRKSGINMVTIATNHSYDYGEEGLLETRQYLQSLGYTTLGTKEQESRIHIEERRGAKIAFLSYTCICAGADTSSVVNVYDEETVKQDMAEAKEKADFICVYMHWGDVDKNEVSDQQRQIAGFLIEQGAGMIIGSHPSTIQPVEIVQNQQGDNVVIAYSLGNYITSYEGNHANMEILLQVELLRNGETGKVYLKSVDYTPIYVLDNGKQAENRYELVDMRQTAENYVAGDTSKITKKTYDEMIKGITWMEEIIR